MRHGQTIANLQDVASGGDRNPGLTAHGVQQARKVAEILRQRDVHPSMIICSPLFRTLSTAKIINEDLQVKIQLAPSFTERRLGQWNGQASTSINLLLRSGEAPPGGESAAQFRERIIGAFGEIAQYFPDWPLLVASRGVARVLLENSAYADAADIPNGELLTVSFSDVNELRISEIKVLTAA